MEVDNFVYYFIIIIIIIIIGLDGIADVTVSCTSARIIFYTFPYKL